MGRTQPIHTDLSSPVESLDDAVTRFDSDEGANVTPLTDSQRGKVKKASIALAGESYLITQSLEAKHTRDAINKRIKREMRRVMHDENASAILAISGYIAALVEVELSRDSTRTDTLAMDAPNILKLFISFTTFSLLYLTIQRHRLHFQLQLERSILPHFLPFYASAQFRAAMYESMWFLIHPLPFIHKTESFSMASGITATYALDEVLVVPMIFRMYTLFPLIHRHANLHTVKAQLAAKLNNLNITVFFTFKAILKAAPIASLACSCTLAWVYLAHCLMIAERGTYSQQCMEERNFDECPFLLYQNCMWNIGITMTTVGYGDIFPTSDPGRAVAFVACLVGTVLLSLLVTVIHRNSEFKEPEENVLTLVAKDDSVVEMQYLAAARLQCAWRTHKISREKSHPLNLHSHMKKAVAFSRLASIIVRWRRFLIKYNYHQHYSFLEKHISDEAFIYRIAKETTLQMKGHSGVSNNGGTPVAETKRVSSERMAASSNHNHPPTNCQQYATQEQLADVQAKQGQMERKIDDQFSRLAVALEHINRKLSGLPEPGGKKS